MGKKSINDLIKATITEKETEEAQKAMAQAAKAAEQNMIEQNRKNLDAAIPKALQKTNTKLTAYFNQLAQDFDLGFKKTVENKGAANARYQYTLSSPSVPALQFYLGAERDDKSGTFEQSLGVLNEEAVARAKVAQNKHEGESKVEKIWPTCTTNHESWETYHSMGINYDVNAAVVTQSPPTDTFFNEHISAWFTALAKTDAGFRKAVHAGASISDADFFGETASVDTRKIPGPKIGTGGCGGGRFD